MTGFRYVIGSYSSTPGQYRVDYIQSLSQCQLVPCDGVFQKGPEVKVGKGHSRNESKTMGEPISNSEGEKGERGRETLPLRAHTNPLS